MKSPWLIACLITGTLAPAVPAQNATTTNTTAVAAKPAMHWADDSSGRPFSKDPSVIRFGGRYLMYYSLPGAAGMQGWSVGIAESQNLTDWKKTGAISPAQECDKKGLAAPAAWVHDGKVHLFYQTYGNGRKDAICHAWSTNGLDFVRNPENPIFAPTGNWTAGRAIDAEVFPIGEQLFLYFATRDPQMKTQMLGVASAPLKSDYGRKQWTQLVDGPILKPELPWERDCIEAASVTSHEGKLWMFYAGGYNNAPQQIGVAVSTNGIHWTRISNQPLVPNGPPGSWNSSESGHPGIFKDADGSFHLFYQGNNDRGKTWYLSKVRIVWKDGLPAVADQ